MANCSDCFNFGDCLQYEGTKYYGLDAACNNVEELCENFKNKADFVEVVRCKDCKYSMKSWITPSYDERQYLCKRTDDYHKPNDFCSYGERKDAE